MTELDTCLVGGCTEGWGPEKGMEVGGEGGRKDHLALLSSKQRKMIFQVWPWSRQGAALSQKLREAVLSVCGALVLQRAKCGPQDGSHPRKIRLRGSESRTYLEIIWIGSGHESLVIH